MIFGFCLLGLCVGYWLGSGVWVWGWGVFFELVNYFGYIGGLGFGGVVFGGFLVWY